MRIRQPSGSRGSLKWIQRAVNQRRDVLDRLVRAELPAAENIRWLSPLAEDDFAEYRDAAFLEKIGQPQLAPALSTIWPARGPQWDALGLTDRGDAILVEAKAHIDEMFSTGSQAGPKSRSLIERTLAETAGALHAKPLGPWIGPLYQMANRIAHLKFLIDRDIAAKLVFVCFLGDGEMRGPTSIGEWRGAIHVVRLMLGLPKRHDLSEHIVHVFVPIQSLS
jgi:hypothetical protein